MAEADRLGSSLLISTNIDSTFPGASSQAQATNPDHEQELLAERNMYLSPASVRSRSGQRHGSRRTTTCGCSGFGVAGTSSQAYTAIPGQWGLAEANFIPTAYDGYGAPTGRIQISVINYNPAGPRLHIDEVGFVGPKFGLGANPAPPPPDSNNAPIVVELLRDYGKGQMKFFNGKCFSVGNGCLDFNRRARSCTVGHRYCDRVRLSPRLLHGPLHNDRVCR